MDKSQGCLSCHWISSNFKAQCCTQSYFEAGMPVWDPKLRPPDSLKSIKINSSKNRQMTGYALVPRCALSSLFCFSYTQLKFTSHKHYFFSVWFLLLSCLRLMFLTHSCLHHYVYTHPINIIFVSNISMND